MKKSVTISLIVIFLGIAGYFYFFSQRTELKEAFCNAEMFSRRPDLYNDALSDTAGLTEEEKEEYLTVYKEELSKYYAADSWATSVFPNGIEGKLDYLTTAAEDPDDEYITGIAECKFHIMYWDEMDQVIVKAKIKFFSKSGESISNDPITIKACMVKEDGVWKVLEHLEYQIKNPL